VLKRGSPYPGGPPRGPLELKYEPRFNSRPHLNLPPELRRVDILTVCEPSPTVVTQPSFPAGGILTTVSTNGHGNTSYPGVGGNPTPRSKWFSSRTLNLPPHRPPINCQRAPSQFQTLLPTSEAGTSPTRRSAARAGHRVWRLSGASGLMLAWLSALRCPEMMKIPGQRIPTRADCSRAHPSSDCSIDTKVGSRIHRRDNTQASPLTRSGKGILPESLGEDAKGDYALVYSGSAHAHVGIKR